MLFFVHANKIAKINTFQVARKKYDEMTIENQGKGDGKEDSDDIVVIPPISDDKTKMREPTVHVS